MTREAIRVIEAIRVFEALRDELRDRLSGVPEYRALVSIEETINELGNLPSFAGSRSDAFSQADHDDACRDAIPLETSKPQRAVNPREQNPMALAVARSLEGNATSTRIQRIV